MIDWGTFNKTTLDMYHRASSGDTSARDDLWEVVKPFMLRHYASYLRRLSLCEGDPLGFCYLAFYDALRLYDPTRGVPFLTYCMKVLKYKLATFVCEAKQILGSETCFSSILEYADSDVDPVDEEEETSSMFGAYTTFNEDDVLIRIVVESMPPQVSKVAVMLIDGYTPIQIMRRLRMSKSSYYRTRKLLRSMLEGLL